jgi:N-acetylglutamate synthase-like GNAT family acetyltransferase
MDKIEIRPFIATDIDGVFSVILRIQSEEFGLGITADHQPDLAVIPDFYQTGHGQFWVAVRDGVVVGTLGLKDIGNGQAALRKMFVAAEVRGSERGVAARLLAALISHAGKHGIKEIFLGTTDKFLAAHRFYEKNDFVEIKLGDLPRTFPIILVDSKFYRRRLA